MHYSERVFRIPLIRAIRTIDLVDVPRRIIDGGDSALLLDNQARMVVVECSWTPLVFLARNMERAVIDTITGIHLGKKFCYYAWHSKCKVPPAGLSDLL